MKKRIASVRARPPKIDVTKSYPAASSSPSTSSKLPSAPAVVRNTLPVVTAVSSTVLLGSTAPGSPLAITPAGVSVTLIFAGFGNCMFTVGTMRSTAAASGRPDASVSPVSRTTRSMLLSG